MLCDTARGIRLLISWPWNKKITLGVGGQNVTAMIFLNVRRGRQKRKYQSDKMWETLQAIAGFEVGKGAMSQGRWAVSKVLERQEKGFSSRASRKNPARPTLGCLAWDPFYPSDLQKCKIMNLHCFYTLKVVVFCYSSNWKRIQSLSSSAPIACLSLHKYAYMLL